MSLITLTVGDSSGDGHEKTESEVFDVNCSVQEFIDAYNKGIIILGFDITSFCEDYEDKKIPIALSKKLHKYFPDEWDDDDSDLDEETFDADPDMFFWIYVLTARLGNPSLVFKEISNQSENIHIGGYGLFY